MSFVIPPFHLGDVIRLIIRVLDKVELWVELWWNYVKFHPNSTHNSTPSKPLIIKAVTVLRWKSGIRNHKKYFSGKRVEKVLTTVKIRTKQGLHHDRFLVNTLKKLKTEHQRPSSFYCRAKVECSYPQSMGSSKKESSVSFSPIMRFAEHLAVAFVRGSAFAPCHHMVSIHFL
mgnify:CR=1 FL=1